MPTFFITDVGEQYLATVTGTKAEAVARAKRIAGQTSAHTKLAFPLRVRESNNRNYNTKTVATIAAPAGAHRSNPSDSALAGARILGVTRNRAGKVTALKLQLRAGAGAGKGDGTKRANPSPKQFAMGAIEHHGPHVSITYENGAYIVRRSGHHAGGHMVESARTLGAARTIAKRLARAGARSNPNHNPFEPGLSRKWYNAGQRAARSSKYADMYDAWAMGRAKPTGNAAITAKESFYQGYMNVAN